MELIFSHDWRFSSCYAYGRRPVSEKLGLFVSVNRVVKH